MFGKESGHISLAAYLHFSQFGATKDIVDTFVKQQTCFLGEARAQELARRLIEYSVSYPTSEIKSQFK